MAKTINVNIRIDENLKKEAEQLFADLGMNMTTAVNVFIRQAINRGGLPFEVVRKEGFYSDYNQQVLRKSIKQLELGQGVAHELIEEADE
jgi:DNA-damage-inducible protein J